MNDEDFQNKKKKINGIKLIVNIVELFIIMCYMSHNYVNLVTFKAMVPYSHQGGEYLKINHNNLATEDDFEYDFTGFLF
jgi:hypothetical protein